MTTLCNNEIHSTTETTKYCPDEPQAPMCDTNGPHPGNPTSLDFEELDSIKQINKSLQQITGKSCHSLMDTLCQEYIQSRDYSEIWNILCKVEGLELWVRKLYWQYQDGSSDDPTKDIFNRIQSVACILEDLLMHAMDGTDVAKMYTRGAFLFQNSPTHTIH